MLFGRKRVLESQLETFQRQQLEERQIIIERKTKTTGFELMRIKSSVVNSYPSCPKSEMTTEDFKNKEPGINRKFGRYVMFKVARLADGVGLDFYTPDDFLEVNRHRLLLPDDGEPEYTRQSVRADIQMIPSRSVDVSGVEAIAEVPYIDLTLGHCLGAIAVERSYGWQNAYH